MRFYDGQVCIDDFGPFRAKIVLGDRWNGFAIPFFTLDVVREMAALTDRLNARYAHTNGGEPIYSPITVNDDGSVTVWDPHNDPDKEELDVYTPDDDGLYAIGAWCWCWDNYTELWIAKGRWTDQTAYYATGRQCEECGQAAVPHFRPSVPCYRPKEHAQADVARRLAAGWADRDPEAKLLEGVWLDEIADMIKEAGFPAEVVAMGGGLYSIAVGPIDPAKQGGPTYGCDLLIGSPDEGGRLKVWDQPVHYREYGVLGVTRIDVDTEEGGCLYESTPQDTVTTIAEAAIAYMRLKEQDAPGAARMAEVAEQLKEQGR